MSSALTGGRRPQDRPVEVGRMEIRLDGPHLADLAPRERRSGDDHSIDALECMGNSPARFEIALRHLHGRHPGCSRVPVRRFG